MSDLSLEERAAIAKFTEAGASHNCPFCQGRMITQTSSGDRIIFLNGARAGRFATVSAQASLAASRSDEEFLVHLDGDPDDWQSRVLYLHDQFTVAHMGLAQDWMCRLSMKDLCALEDGTIRALFRAYESGARTIRVEVAQTLAAIAWGRRLPIDGLSLWPMLAVHGFDDGWQSEFCRLFDFGVSLLVATHRRRPIKKKLVEPMFVGN